MAMEILSIKFKLMVVGLMVLGILIEMETLDLIVLQLRMRKVMTQIGILKKMVLLDLKKLKLQVAL